MAGGFLTVILPDGTTLRNFPDTFSVEQVRQALIATNNTQVSGATATQSADGKTITFAAAAAGRKG